MRERNVRYGAEIKLLSPDTESSISIPPGMPPRGVANTIRDSGRALGIKITTRIDRENRCVWVKLK